jgi:sugar/nucleoside kinase (ribokinase family)
MPGLFAQFFEEFDVDTTQLLVYPGQTPASWELAAPDGHLLIPRAGVSALAAPIVPQNAFTEFDVVVANPGPPPTRQGILRKLRLALRRSAGTLAALGICGGPDWTAADLELVHNLDCLLFFNEDEATRTARRLQGDDRIGVEQAAGILKQSLGRTALVITLGRRGALMLNGQPQPHFTPATPIDGKDTTGLGDWLLASTAVDYARSRLSPENSLERGVSAVEAELLARPG